MKETHPDYNDCITNVACSIQKYFNVDYKHNTISDIDEMLDYIENYDPEDIDISRVKIR